MDFKDFLKQGLTKLKIDVEEKQLELFERYYDFYQFYTKKINLSTIKDGKEFIIKHILDSASGFQFFQQNKRIADLGSGAGFPGLVLKILNQDLNITLLEVIQKKIDFLNDIIHKLKLNVTVFNNSQGKVSEKFDIITCRAFSSLEKIVKISRKIMPKKSLIIAYKGKKAKIEEEMKPYIKEKAEIIPIKVPFLEAERNIILIHI